EKAFKVGGSFKTDMFAVNLVIENTTDTVALTGSDTKIRNIYVAGQYNISSSDAVKVALTKTGDMKVAGVTSASSGAKQLTVGYDHMMSKRTTVYALYTKLSNSTNGTYELTGAGTSAAGLASTANAKPSAFSVGMKHSF
ncbi:MAG: porin, partial [Gallionellaceae bacterium]|nr:porin [Gallionellaceae bacterium]